MTAKSTPGHTISLKEVIDISIFQGLSDSFSRLTGISTALLDDKGQILVTSGWQKICTAFHRKCPDTTSRCLASDTALAGQLAKGEKYAVYTCKDGLVYVAVPIIIENTHVGNLFAGQFFFAPPDIDYFTRQAEQFGFDTDSYLEALSKVPVFSTERIQQAMSYLTDLTVVIGNIGRDRKKLFASNQHLEQQVQDRTADLQTEIHLRRKTELELQTSKRFLESVFNAIQDGISVLDKDLNILQVNKIMHHWYPHLAQSMGEKCYKMYHGRSEPCEICPSIQALKSKKMEMAEVPFQTHDHMIGTQELFSYPMKNSSGDIEGIVEYVRDISERRLAENQIQIEKKFSESLINSLPGILYVFDQSGRFKRWNRNFEIVTGYSAHQLKDMHPLDFIAPDDKARVRKTIEKVFHKGNASVEAKFSTFSGQHIPYLFTGYRFVQQISNYL
jgi:PAS domain S-box-containing protein